MSDAHKAAPAVTIELNGKQTDLIFNFGALALFEKRTGKSMMTGEVFQRPMASDLIALVWAGVNAAHKEFDVDTNPTPAFQYGELCNLMSFSDFEEIEAALNTAMDAVTSGKKGKTGKKKTGSKAKSRRT